MAFIHGKTTVVSIDGDDISAFTNSVEFNDGHDIHDVTCFTAGRKSWAAGLGDGKVTLAGVYDDGAGGPRATLKPLMAAGLPVTFLFKPEGTGAGKAQSSVSVLVTAFNESAPVADMIKWTAELQMTGALTETDQS